MTPTSRQRSPLSAVAVRITACARPSILPPMAAKSAAEGGNDDTASRLPPQLSRRLRGCRTYRGLPCSVFWRRDRAGDGTRNQRLGRDQTRRDRGDQGRAIGDGAGNADRTRPTRGGRTRLRLVESDDRISDAGTERRA